MRVMSAGMAATSSVTASFSSSKVYDRCWYTRTFNYSREKSCTTLKPATRAVYLCNPAMSWLALETVFSQLSLKHMVWYSWNHIFSALCSLNKSTQSWLEKVFKHKTITILCHRYSTGQCSPKEYRPLKCYTTYFGLRWKVVVDGKSWRFYSDQYRQFFFSTNAWKVGLFIARP